MNTDIVFDISDQKKNTNLFNSKILLRSELVQYRQITDFARAVNPLISIGFPIVTQSSENVCFPTLDELTSQKNFRVESFCIFFLVRNVKTNVHVHLFDL